MIKIMYFFVALAILAGVLNVLYVSDSNQLALPVEEEGVVCTMDAQQCGDGSYVGRTGVNCEFVCPDVSVPAEVADIIVDSPIPNSVLLSGETISGQASGWYFEAVFPVQVLDYSGAVIGSGPATAAGDWMTSDFVPFNATISFVNPYQSGDPEIEKTGILRLQNDNPSGLPENQKTLDIAIRFAL